MLEKEKKGRYLKEKLDYFLQKAMSINLLKKRRRKNMLKF